jgi:hypothetical protein
MPALLTQNWLVNLVLPVIALITIALSAWAVWRQAWFSIRPVLSTYIWFVTITSALALVIYFLQIPKALSYEACRVYLAIYYVTDILTALFSVAVLYEFLLRMAGTNKMIQRTAIIGFLITVSGDLAAAYWLATQWPGNRLENVVRFLFETTALALLVSGLFIFLVKRRRSLLLESRLFVVLAALMLHGFIILLSDFILRRSEQMRLVVADIIWIGFSILLYWALKNGPAISGTATSIIELAAKL